MSFLQLLLFLLHHLVRIIPLTQKPHAHTDSSVISASKTIHTAFPSTTKAPKCLSVPFIFFSFLCGKLVYRMFWTACYFSNSSQTCTHKGTDIYTRGGFNIHHVSLMWLLQEHRNLCDWKSRLWVWSGFMTFCRKMSDDRLYGTICGMLSGHRLCFGNNSFSDRYLPTLVQIDFILNMLPAALTTVEINQVGINQL